MGVIVHRANEKHGVAFRAYMGIEYGYHDSFGIVVFLLHCKKACRGKFFQNNALFAVYFVKRGNGNDLSLFYKQRLAENA